MITYMGGDFNPTGAIRRYHHPRLGVLSVLTMYGEDGSADVVELYGAMIEALTRARMQAGEDVLTAAREAERLMPRRPYKPRKPRKDRKREAAPEQVAL
jgi:hypothetical protein